MRLRLLVWEEGGHAHRWVEVEFWTLQEGATPEGTGEKHRESWRIRLGKSRTFFQFDSHYLESGWI